MKKLVALSLILVVLLNSCGDEMAYLPKSKFQGEIPLKADNPSKFFSEEFSVRDTHFEGQDQKYKVIYHKDKAFTTILDKLQGDTLFQGYCYEDKGIWFFKYQLTDSTFWLSAVEKEKNKLKGWPISWGQSFKVDSVLKSGNTSFDTLDSKFTLVPSKKNLRLLYEEVFSHSSSSRYELIKQKEKKFDFGRRVLNKGKNVISKITPDMDAGYIDVNFKKFSNYTIDLFVKDGPLAKEVKVIDKNLAHIDVSELEEGFYLMEVNDSSSGKLLVRSEIYIENK